MQSRRFAAFRKTQDEHAGENGQTEMSKSLSRSPRSPTGPGNFSFKGSLYIARQEKDWIEIQKTTFTNWCNAHLRHVGIEITDLASAFEDGVTLVHLVEAVSTKKISPREFNKKPRMYAQKLDNITAAMKVLSSDGINLLSIGNEDILNGNLKLILGLIWRLILHYQISSSGSASGKQLLITWLRSVIPDLDLKNVTTDWNDGIALNALLEFCKPGFCPNYKQLRPEDSLQNVTNAMGAAEKDFHIPMVISPDFFVSPYVDELSMMTYLSYFTQPGSIGEKRSLEYVNDVAPQLNTKNFSTDWNDGKALCTFMESLCPGTLPGYELIDSNSPVENASMAIEAAHDQLGIRKVITAEEMANPAVDDLNIMAYVLQFRTCEKTKSYAHTFNVEGSGVKRGTKGKASEFYVFGRRDIGVEHVQAQVQSPTSGSVVEVTKRVMPDGSLCCQFTPLESGDHTIVLKQMGKQLPNSPFHVKVLENVGELLVTGSGLKHAVVMKPAEFVVQTNAPIYAPITAVAVGPNDCVPVTIERTPEGALKGVFTPREVGEYKISMEMGNTPIPGSPFKTKVGDPSKCVLGVKDGARFPSLGRPVTFEVDTSVAGLGELAIQCQGPKGNVPVDVKPISPDKYSVSYIPDQKGEYNIGFNFNGQNIMGSPYTTFVTDPSQIVAQGAGLSQAVTGSRTEFVITLYGAAKKNELDVYGEGPDGRFPVEVEESADSPNTCNVHYTPQRVGEHNIYVSHASIPVRGSPFTVRVANPTQVKFATHLQGAKPKQYAQGNEIDIPLQVPSSAGDGDIEASVLGPDLQSVPVNVVRGADDYQHIRFVPRTAGEHKVRVLFAGREISNSPYKIQVHEAVYAKVKEEESFHAMQEVSPLLHSENPPAIFASDASRIEAYGEGLGQAVTTSQAEFSVTLHGAHKENLEIHAEGPDGRLPVTVEESPKHHDTCSVLYTPQTVGEHKIYVSHANVPVPGSPFTVKVADPRQVKFSTHHLKEQPKQYVLQNEVDIPLDVPMSAGDGILEASVVGPDLQSIPTSVSKEEDGYHHIRFVPKTAGEHKFRVLYGGQEVSNSPYTIQVHEATTTKVKEVEQTTTGYRAKREVDVPIDVPEEIDEISASVKGPDNGYVPSKLEREADGLFHVRFVPSKAGKYTVDVRCAGEPVENSPFVMKIAEPENVQVQLKQFEQQGNVQYHMGHQVDVPMEIPKEVEDVSASVTGPDGERVPSTFLEEADGLKHLRFVPTKTGRFQVNIRCRDTSVAGSPFLINVVEPKSTAVTLQEPAENETKYLVRRELDIAFAAPDGSRDMSCSVDGPDGEEVQSTLEKGDDGCCHAKFVPFKAGTYKVHLRNGGQPVHDSPYLIEVHEPSEVRVAHVRSEEQHAERVAKNEVDLALDGPEGMSVEKLSASVSGPENEVVPSHVSRGPDGHFHVKFTPHQPGLHLVDVRYEGQSVEGSPFTVNVVGKGRPTVKLGHDINFNTTSEADIPIELPAGSTPGQLTASVTDPSNESLRTVVVQEDTNLFHVRFVPIRGGAHTVNVKYAGVPLDNSPFIVNVEDTDELEGHSQCHATGDGLREGIVNEKTEFKVDARRAGRGWLTSHLSGVKYNTDVEVRDRGDGTYDCHYLVPVPGAYVLAVKWNGQHVNGSPYKVTVRQSEASSHSRLVVEGHALREGSGAFVGQPMGFAINSKDAGPGQLYVRCQGPSRDCDVNVFDNKDGTYQIQIHPAEIGNHLVYVEWGGRPVHGSPFLVRVGQAPDPSKVRVYGPGLENGILRLFKGNFMVDTKGAGPGTLKIRIHGPRGAFKVEMYRDTTKERTIGVRYNPVEVGRYIVNIKWADQHIPGSPFDVTIVDSKEELDSINQLSDNAVPYQMSADTLRMNLNGYH